MEKNWKNSLNPGVSKWPVQEGWCDIQPPLRIEKRHETWQKLEFFFAWRMIICKSLEGRKRVLPRNLTWNLKMMVSKRNHIFQGLLFRFHVRGVHFMNFIKLVGLDSLVLFLTINFPKKKWWFPCMVLKWVLIWSLEVGFIFLVVANATNAYTPED